jgi:hypothetical protein
MGSILNDSGDALPLVELVEYLVAEYYPDYGPLWRSSWPPALEDLARKAFGAHMARYVEGPWGWKLCETGYILPVIDALFPNARYIHLIRDGRDVAFCDHVAPQTDFWKKIYFNTDRLTAWRGRPLSHSAYSAASHVYNARHWVNSVEVGRAYGAMLRGRYLEIRYEDLCVDFIATMRKALAFASVAPNEDALSALRSAVATTSIGKFRRAPKRRRRDVMAEIEPTLLALGYAEPSTPSAATRLRGLAAHARWRLRAGR